MNNKNNLIKLNVIVIISVFFIVISSCSSPKMEVVTQEELPSKTLSSSDVTTSIPLVTPTPSNDGSTPTKTLTSSQDNQDQSIPPTTTPEENEVVSTLTTEEKFKLISELFLNNDSCSFPCWWGITPGSTSWDDSQILLANMGVVIGRKVEINDTYSGYGLGGIQVSTSNGIIDNHMSILVNNETERVSLIRFDSDGYSDPIAFQEQWMNFSPQMIIQKYGAPSRVWVESSSNSSNMAGEGRIAGYRLWFIYDKAGILLQYSGYGELSENYHFCPRFDQGEDIRSILLFIQSPDSLVPIEEKAKKLNLFVPDYPHIQTLEESSGITIEQFTNLFIKDPDNACFDTPSSIWP